LVDVTGFGNESVTFVIEFITVAIQFIPLAIEFVTLVIKFVILAIEFVTLAIEFWLWIIKRLNLGIWFSNVMGKVRVCTSVYGAIVEP